MTNTCYFYYFTAYYYNDLAIFRKIVKGFDNYED